MTRTAEERDALKAQALDAVQFDRNEYLAGVPRSLDDRMRARRQTLRQSIDIQESATARGDDETDETALEKYRRATSDSVWGTFIIDLDNNDFLWDDVIKKMEEVCETASMRARQPAFTFTPLSVQGRQLLRTMPALLTLENFQKMTDEQLPAFFYELLLRTTHSYAAFSQLREALSLIRLTFENANVFREVTDTVADELEDANRQLAEAKKEIERLKAANPDAASAAELAAVRDQVEDLRVTVEARDGQIIDLKGELQKTNATIGELITSGRIGTSAVSRTNSKDTRSGKLPDPPIFYDDKVKDNGLSFKAWYRQMENKLLVNADHFPLGEKNDRAKMAYVESRVGGSVSESLAPYVDKDNAHRYTTCDEVMKHLWQEYNNPNEKADARAEYAALKQVDFDTFLSFKNKFVELSGRLSKPRSEFKHEFHPRLTYRLQSAMSKEYSDESVAWEEYLKKCQQEDAEHKRLDKLKQQATGRGRQNKDSDGGNATPINGGRNTRLGGGGGSTANGRTSRPQTPNVPRLDEDAFREHQLKGLCYTCHKEGHRSRDCPDKARTVAQEKEDRISALFRKQFGNAAQPPASNKEKLDFAEN
jgi:hypothetical protein